MEYSYGMYCEDLYKIKEQIEKRDPQIDEVVAIARGGCVLGVQLSHYLNKPLTVVDWSLRDGKCRDWDAVRYLQSGLVTEVNGLKCKRYLFVDDILDSGETLISLFDTLRVHRVGKDISFHNQYLAVLVRNVACPYIIPDFSGREIDRRTDPKWVNFWWETK